MSNALRDNGNELALIPKTIWQPETIVKLRTRLRVEFEAGYFDRDFEDKLAARGIPLYVVRQIISSHRSYIVKYYDRFDGTRRIGLWHPSNKHFLAWKPGPHSHFKTCFKKVTGLEYLNNLTEVKMIYLPEGERNGS